MHEFIDTHGFFVRHARQRRAAVLLPVQPSPEVETSHVMKDEHRRARRAADDNNKVRATVAVAAARMLLLLLMMMMIRNYSAGCVDAVQRSLSLLSSLRPKRRASVWRLSVCLSVQY